MKFLKISIVVVSVLLLWGIGSSAHAEVSFFRMLAAKPNATMEDAIKAVYMLNVGESASEKMTFAEIRDIMLQKKLIKKSHAKDPDRLANRGQVAYMVCKALGIRGGLTMRIFGISERYGFRECTYLGLIPGGSQWDKVSGSELVGILAHAADYREKLRPKEKKE